MNKYTLVVQTTVAMPQWQYEFSMGSESMAIDYAERIAKQFAGVRWFMELSLFSETGVVANFRLAEPTIKVERA